MSYDLLWLPVGEHGAWMSVGTGLAGDVCHARIVTQFDFRFLVTRTLTHEAACLVELVVLVGHLLRSAHINPALAAAYARYTNAQGASPLSA